MLNKLEIESLRQYYEAQIGHLRQRAVCIDTMTMDIESFHIAIKELQDRNFANQSKEKSFEIISHIHMQTLMNLEIRLKNLLQDCNGIEFAKTKNAHKSKSVKKDSKHSYEFLAVLHSKTQELKESLTFAQTDLEDILNVSRLMQKNGELISLMTLKLSKKVMSPAMTNGVLQDISIKARQVIKTLDGIGEGLQSATECICQKYEQLQMQLREIIAPLEWDKAERLQN
ncbi:MULTISPECIES: hypothetical protein [Helicobacter]|uniref:hypothetical protein n=1 Tax=Helicobacter TaxID=209 RepID=UPI00262BE226|nr:hypothetical protein [Helicobacter sp. UBA3407]